MAWILRKQEVKSFKALQEGLFLKLDKVVDFNPWFHSFTIWEIFSQENPHKPISYENGIC